MQSDVFACLCELELSFAISVQNACIPMNFSTLDFYSRFVCSVCVACRFILLFSAAARVCVCVVCFFVVVGSSVCADEYANFSGIANMFTIFLFVVMYSLFVCLTHFISFISSLISVLYQRRMANRIIHGMPMGREGERMSETATMCYKIEFLVLLFSVIVFSNSLLLFFFVRLRYINGI